MMHLLKKALVISTVCSMMLVGPIQVLAENDSTAEVKKVELTVQQKSELAALHKEILEKRKEVINKYVQFGVMTEEKGKKVISHLEDHYAKMEKNGFIPKYDKHHKKHHRE